MHAIDSANASTVTFVQFDRAQRGPVRLGTRLY
jgi:hypothetical protein